MKAVVSTFFFLMFFLHSWSQTAVITGEVRNEDNELLPGLPIQQKDQPTNGALTNDLGRFSITIPAGRPVALYIAISDKIIWERTFELAPGEKRDIQVKTDPFFLLDPVDVVGNQNRRDQIQRIEPKLRTKLPTPGGGIEGLLIQGKGVNVVSELSSAYSVRGGSFDENLIYVNDIQVYRPFLVRAGEQEGLSFPNVDMVESIEFSAGGFHAKYGDKMSSVLDIKYKRPKKFGGNAMMSFLGGSLQLEGRSPNGKFTHNTGFRYKSNTYVLNSLDTRGDYDPRYTDLQTYLTYSPKEYGNLEFSFLGNYARNKYTFIPQTRQTDIGTFNEALRFTVFFEGKEQTEFETFFGALSTRYQPTPTSQLKFIASAFRTFESEHFDVLGAYSLDELERDPGSDSFGEVLINRGIGAFLQHGRNDLDATVLNFTHKGFIDYEASANLIEWGFEVQSEQINDRLNEWTLVDSAGYASPRPQDIIVTAECDTCEWIHPDQLISFQDAARSKNNISSARMSAFIQDTKEWKNNRNEKWTVNGGVRSNYWTFSEELLISPRMSFSYSPRWKSKRVLDSGDTLDHDLIITFATGVYYQPPFYREMRGFDGQVNQDIKAQQSIHFILGADYIFYAWERPFKFVTEFYYKDLDQLIPYEVENVRQRYFATNNSYGYAVGADFMINGEFIPGVQSWLRAGLLKTEEDLRDDFYYQYINSDGEIITPGFTFNNVPVDTIRIEPGAVPRPQDQRFSFAMLFQDEMPRWPEYKVLLSFYFGTGLPYGPPSRERYLDINRTQSYIRSDIGFARDLINYKKDPKKNWFNRHLKDGQISLEVFNLLGVNNTVNHQWVEDVYGRVYGIPTFLTGRRLNLRLSVSF